jgi:transaldolase
MKFIIDDVSLEKIKKYYKFTVDSITSDSSIITEYGKKSYVILDFEKLFGQGKNMLNYE